MKTIARRRLVRWCTVASVCVTVIGFGVHMVYRDSFRAHVIICTGFPSVADFTWMTRVSDKSIGELLERDRFAYQKFTQSFSNPVRVSAWNNGAILYLTRIWKANDGYLILTSGRDPIDCELHIQYENEMPRMIGEPFAKVVEMTTVTPAFLEDYKVRMIPIGPRSGSVEHMDSTYSSSGQIVEQAGTGQPATRPESKSDGGDKPQPDSEGRSR